MTIRFVLMVNKQGQTRLAQVSRATALPPAAALRGRV
jgi:hypothetical protein